MQRHSHQYSAADLPLNGMDSSSNIPRFLRSVTNAKQISSKIQTIVLAGLLSLFPLRCEADGVPADISAQNANSSDRMPDGWHLTEEWSYIGHCTARAMIAYSFIADRRQGKTTEDQIKALQQRDDLGSEKRKYVDELTGMLHEMDDLSANDLLEYPPNVAAACLSSSPVFDADCVSALTCFNEYKRPLFEIAISKNRETVRQISFKESEEGMYTCLLGSPSRNQ